MELIAVQMSCVWVCSGSRMKGATRRVELDRGRHSLRGKSLDREGGF